MNLERDVESLKQEPEEAKWGLQAANDCADGLLILLIQDTYALASHVITASHRRNDSCCDELSFLLGTFEGAGKKMRAAFRRLNAVLGLWYIRGRM